MLSYTKRLNFFLFVSLLIAIVGLVQTTATYSQSTEGEQFPERFSYRTTVSPSAQADLLDNENNGNMEGDQTAVTNLTLPWSKMAYQSYRAGNWNVFVSNDNGGQIVEVSQNGGSDIHPHLQRGAALVVYAAEDSNQFDIATVKIANHQRTFLTRTQWDEVNPRWSPDGSKVVFESYQHGQADIFVMNANGTNVKRLTTNADYDGMPDWSPDGSKIVFTSRRNNQIRIYTMNANGSNVTKLNTLPYSFRPRWSPDGKRIMFDADPQLDGFQRLYVMDADGSNVVLFLNGNGAHDQLSGSWSPDGNKALFTQVNYVLYQGTYYINRTTTHYYNADYPNNSSTKILGENLDFFPHWQTTDTHVPNTAIAPIRTVSPFQFQLDLSNGDTGGSGFRGLDLQVKIGNNGAWQDLLTDSTETTLSYTGTGGQKYTFRARGYDNSWNYSPWSTVQTTVEAEAPKITFVNQSDFARVGGSAMIDWHGFDPGGSGVRSYDLQYRVDGGAWQDLLTNTTKSVSRLPITQSDQTITFRARGEDHANNLSDWVSFNVDTETVNWSLQGASYDNTFTPIQSSDAANSPSTTQTVYEGLSPNFETFVISEDAEQYHIGWSPNGFGVVPTTTYSASVESEQVVVYPPHDNLLENGAFETESGTGWDISSIDDGIRASQLSVTSTMGYTINQQAAHTGQFGFQSFAPSYLLEDEATSLTDSYPEFAGEMNGTFYFYNITGSGNSWMATIQTTNDLNQPLTQLTEISHPLTDQDQYVRIEGLIVDKDGGIHIIMEAYPRLYHIYSNDNGNSWTEAIAISPEQGRVTWFRDVLLDSQGGLHVLWSHEYISGIGISSDGYAYRPPSGSWHSPQIIRANPVPRYDKITDTYSNHGGVFFIDENDGVHLVWEGYGNRQSNYFYFYKPAPGSPWSANALLTEDVQIGRQLIIPDTSSVNIIYQEYQTNDIRHIRAFPDGSAQMMEDAPPFPPNAALIDKDGTVHMANSDYYAIRPAYGNWSIQESFDFSYGWIRQFEQDRTGAIHIVSDPSQGDTIYRYQIPGENWSSGISIAGETVAPFIFDSDDQLHFIWNEGGTNARSYARSDVDRQNTLSQTVTVPVSMTTPILSFLYKGAAVSAHNNLQITVTSDSGQFTDEITEVSGAWTHYWADLSDFAGETVTINLTHNQKAGEPITWFYLDDITLGSTYPDVYVQAETFGTRRGEQVELTIPFGNQGGATADDISLEITLPDGLELVSASPMPQVNGSRLNWEWDSFDAKEFNNLTLVLQSSGQLEVGDELDIPIDISTTSSEQQASNNEASLTVSILAYELMLPHISSE